MRLFILSLLILAACQKPVPPTVLHQSCGADGYSNLIGQSADILAAMTFPAPVRIIKPGMAITMDYSESRLNFDLDSRNHITRVWCG